ncbi:MAG: hypothetical protein VB875_08340 [Pirellulales bacterium]
MAIRVEFYGVPRVRAGITETTSAGRRLEHVLTDLETRFPGLAECCIAGGKLRPGYVANLDGQRFTTDEQTELSAYNSVLILSADAGGA